MKKKTLVASIAGLLYVIFVVCGYFFLNDDDFSENVLFFSFIYCFAWIAFFYGAKWQITLIEKFMNVNNLNFLLIICVILNFVGVVSSFIIGEGTEKLMYYTAYMSAMNACICLYVYLE